MAGVSLNRREVREYCEETYLVGGRVVQDDFSFGPEVLDHNFTRVARDSKWRVGSGVSMKQDFFRSRKSLVQWKWKRDESTV